MSELIRSDYKPFGIAGNSELGNRITRVISDEIVMIRIF